MSNPTSDRNLLFGILAVQLDFITRDALITAMNAWVLDKVRPLGEILVARKALTAETRDMLETLVEKHLHAHGRDPRKSLAAVSAAGSIKRELADISDPALHASLASLGPVEEKYGDPYATASVGVRSSSGLRFQVLRPHAKGGLGEVFVAHDVELNREVALKEIQARHADDAGSRARFLLEAEITGGLEHPGVVPVYGSGEYSDGRPYYAMRFIRGHSMQEVIDQFHKSSAENSTVRERRLALRKLIRSFQDACNAVQYAHDRGILHRDLKPANIMLGKHGETLVVDWGLAKAVGTREPAGAEPALRPVSSGSAETLPGSAVGTPSFMSPEQASGRLDRMGPASDVYSLGATLYCLLTGHAPVEAKDIATTLHQVQNGDFPRPSERKAEIDPALEAICLKAMHRDPVARYAAPNALADDLDHWLADEPVAAWREPWSVTARRWLARRRTAVAAGAVALVMGLVGLGVVAAVQHAANIDLSSANENEREAKQLARASAEEARKERDEARRLERLAADSEAEAKRQRDEAHRLGKIASDNAAAARDQRTLALEALKHTVFDIYDDIGDIPELRGLRHKLLGKALSGLQRVARSAENSADLDHSLAWAYFQMGDITLSFDDKKSTKDYYHTAYRLVEPIARAKPDDPTAQRDLAVAHARLGKMNLESKQLRPALEQFTQAYEVLEKLSKRDASDRAAKHDLAIACSHVGDVQARLGNTAAAEKLYRQALELHPTNAAAMVIFINGTVNLAKDKVPTRRLTERTLLRVGDRLQVPTGGEVRIWFLHDNHRERIRVEAEVTVSMKGCLPVSLVERMELKLPEPLPETENLGQLVKGAVGELR